MREDNGRREPQPVPELTYILTIRGLWRGVQKQDHGYTVARALGLCMEGD